METQVMAVRAICPHGKVRMLVVDDPRAMKEAKRDIATMVQEGFTIDRVTVEVARKSDMNCEPCDADWEANHPRRKKRA